MTTTKPQSTTEPPCTNSCSGCKNCDHHFYLRDNGQLECKHCLYSRPVTRFEVDAISLVGRWNYEEPFWWTPIATALAKEFREGQTRAALRQYFCSCGGALTAEEYITHYFDLGHDRGDPASAAPVVDNDRTRCASCRHSFCKDCCDIGECCKCDTEIPPRTVAERLAQHEHIEVVDGVLGGVTPLVSRTRISVHHILSYLHNGENIHYIAKNYQLSPEAIKDAIAFAQDVYDDAVDLALRIPAAATAAPVEQQTFKNTKEAMLYAQRNKIPAVVPVEESESADSYYHMGQRESQLAKKFIAAVKAEQLHEDLDNPEDAGYRNAINDALEAIRSVCAEEGIEVGEK